MRGLGKLFLGVLIMALPASAQAQADIDPVGSDQAFQACFDALERAVVPDVVPEELEKISACGDILDKFWEWKPPLTSEGLSADWKTLQADIVGSGECFRKARQMGDPERAAQMVAFFRTTWRDLMNEAAAGEMASFAWRVRAFAGAVNQARMGYDRWEPESEPAIYWNSRCAGFFGTDRVSTNAEAPRGLETVLDGAQGTMTISGVIEPGFTDQLSAALDSNQFLKRLQLGSVGGTDFREAIKAGRMLRERGVFTTALGNCESACALMFIGGQLRIVGDNAIGRLGFHRLSFMGMAVPEDSELYDEVRTYLEDMHANVDMVMGFMTAADGLDFTYPTLEELCLADAIGNALPRETTENPAQMRITKMMLERSGGSFCMQMRFLDRYDNRLSVPDN